MSVIVELIFTGIVAFVPLGQGEVAAVMPNAMHEVMHPHVPWMKVNQENVDPNPSFNKQRGDEGAWLLRETELSIEGAASGMAEKEDDGDYGETPHGTHLTSVHWVASFPRIQPKATVKLAFLHAADGDLKKAASPLKSLWFKLPAGKFSTKRAPKCVWALKGTAAGQKAAVRQALAQEVAYEFTLDTDSVVLNERDLYNETTRQVRLHPGADHHITITLGNTQIDDIFPQNRTLDDPDVHFRLYYKMLDGISGNEAYWSIPHRLDRNCAEPAPAMRASDSRRPGPMTNAPDPIDTKSLHGTNCPPAFMY